MPVRDETRYPGGSLRSPEWLAIRHQILDRARNRCEWCQAGNYEPHPETGSKVVLTIAHLDHTPENSDPDNLRALCQRCHLNYDRHLHAANAARTRETKRTKNMNPLPL